MPAHLLVLLALNVSAFDSLIGQAVRDLLITERIGSGGMGAVYKATHRLLHEPRAVKVIRSASLGVPDLVERFQREARIAVKLKHPNLVLVYDYFIEGDSHFLVMEYLTGETLKSRLAKAGALPLEDACRIALQCAAGLGYAHEMGIIHRDLAPDNILLIPSAGAEQVKIIDFGLAKQTVSRLDASPEERDVTVVGANLFLGKPKYASPEQVGGLRESERIDHRSDIYSLGVILYEMVTGAAPFRADSAVAYLLKHIGEKPRPPSQSRPGLPSELDALILRCLEKDRELRFRSLREVAEALERVRAKSKGSWDDPATGTEKTFVIARPPEATVLIDRPSLEATARIDRASLPPQPHAPEPEAAATTPPAAIRRGLWSMAATVAALMLLAIASRFLSKEKGAPAPPIELSRKEVPIPTIGAPYESSPAAVERDPTPYATVGPGRRQAPARIARAIPPTPKVISSALPFPSREDMDRAFNEAIGFEASHDSKQAISKWKAFLARGPSPELAEKARWRITQLTLDAMPALGK